MDKQNLSPEQMKTLSDMYAEMRGVEIDPSWEMSQGKAGFIDKERDKFRLIDFDDLNILMELLDWWMCAGALRWYGIRHRFVLLRTVDDERELSWGDVGLDGEPVDCPNLSTAIAVALTKIKEG